MTTAIDWPSNVPQEPLSGALPVSEDMGVLVTEMDHGPRHQRRLYTAIPERFSVAFIFTEAEVANFWTFYRTTLQGGILTFNFTHPTTGSQVECRFQNLQSPAFQHVNTGRPNGTTTPYYHASLAMETVPT